MNIARHNRKTARSLDTPRVLNTEMGWGDVAFLRAAQVVAVLAAGHAFYEQDNTRVMVFLGGAVLIQVLFKPGGEEPPEE